MMVTKRSFKHYRVHDAIHNFEGLREGSEFTAWGPEVFRGPSFYLSTGGPSFFTHLQRGLVFLPTGGGLNFFRDMFS